MNGIAQRLGHSIDDDPGLYDPSGRLAAYEERTQTPLDLLALVTIWLVVVPPWDFSANNVTTYFVWAARAAISITYGIDLTIRSGLARRHVQYVLLHPLALLSVLIPPVRVIFSIRLVRSMFRRGNLGRFLLAAALLVLNGAAIVYLVERHAPGSNIHTFGESVWWAFVTVTTVGYGDYTPVTPAGRVTACFIMATGLLTLAVVTAQVASSFVAQAPSRARSDLEPQAIPPQAPPPQASAPQASAPQASAPPATSSQDVTLAELDRRLARIEELLLAAAPSSRRTASRGEPSSE